MSPDHSFARDGDSEFFSEGNSDTNPTPSIVLENISKHFDGRAVLDNFSVTVGDGEFVAVLGPSGTGKTTLLRILLGLEDVDAGTALIAERRSVVFQEPRLVAAQRVWRNILLDERRSTDSRRRATAALREVGLESKARAWPATLSGGEAQRVALARAMVGDPRLLLLDEPFASLDALTRLRMHALVEALWEERKPTVVLVTHDVDEAISLADRILFITDGKVARDIRISAPRRRDAGADWYRNLRRLLLTQLGVQDL